MVALVGVLVLSGPRAGGAGERPTEGHPQEKSAKDPEPVEVRFTDNSTLKLTLREEKIEVVTRYGRLLIPVADIRRIEFASRVSDDVSKRAEMAIANLGSPQFKTREAASAELRALREKAYPTLLQAAKSGDQEAVRRVEELLSWLRENVPSEQLEVRQQDVVYTEEMKVTGRISTGVLKVYTYQFGELPLKLADLRSLRSMSATEPEAEPRNVLADPGNLMSLQAQVGKTFFIRVTGAVNGSVWGTDVYTADSSLAAAAVHAGAVQAGQTGVVKVTMVPPQPAFAGSTRNGVTSSAYGAFTGAFRVSR
jgi:hypothetical protein